MNNRINWMSAAVFFSVTVLSAFETPQQAVDASAKAIREKNYTEAHRCLEEGFKLCVNPTEKIIVLTRRAELYRTQKDFANAEKMIKEIINDGKMTPQQKASAWLSMARYKDIQRDSEGVVDAYQKTLELVNEGTVAQETLNKLGLALARVKDYSSALECFKQVAATPNKDEKRSLIQKRASYFNTANVYAMMKQYSNSVKTLNDAAALPEFNSKKDQEDFKKAVKKIYETQIREAVRFRKFDDAETALNDLRKFDSSAQTAALEIQILKGRASAAARARKDADAGQFYRKALEVKGANSGDMIGVYGDFINFCIGRQKTDDAGKLLEELRKISCRNAEDQFNVNTVAMRYLCSVKKYDEAIKLMEETAELKDLRPARIARCYELAALVCISNKKDVQLAGKYVEKAEKVPGANWRIPAHLKKNLGK